MSDIKYTVRLMIAKMCVKWIEEWTIWAPKESMAVARAISCSENSDNVHDIECHEAE